MRLLDRHCEHSYIPKYLGGAPVVVDLGANHGEFTRFMTQRFGARCIAVEPNPLLFGDLGDAGPVEIIAAAIGSSDGISTLHVSSAKDDTSSLIGRFPGDRVSETVRTVSLEHLLDTLDLKRIDLLKVDIEGIEVEALKALRPNQLERIRQCTVEFHDGPGYVTKHEIRMVTDKMRESGFRVLKMSATDYSDVLYVQANLCSLVTWARIRFGEIPFEQARRFLHRLVAIPR